MIRTAPIHYTANPDAWRQLLTALGGTVVVGPEGGITPDELAAFTAAGASPYRLGRTVLRTSTAGLAAAAVLLAASDRWA